MKSVDSSTSLSRYAPEAQFRSAVEVTVHASPQDALAAVRSVTLKDMPVARWMGEVRYLPGRLVGKGPSDVAQDEPFLTQLQQGGTLLLEATGNEIVTGSAGKYHQILDQEPKPFSSPTGLLEFSDPDYEKLFISIRAEPAGPDLTTLHLEHWTLALGPRAKKKFARYWIAIRPTGDFVSRQLLLAAKRRAEAH